VSNITTIKEHGMEKISLELMSRKEIDILSKVTSVIQDENKSPKMKNDLRLKLVNVTTMGKKLASLVDIGATHIFIIERTVNSLQQNKEE